MSSKRIRTKMLTQMSKQSLKYSLMRNTFVMITIALASALLMAILMYAAGQKEDTKRQLSHAQQVGYYNLSASQAEALKMDERIAYQIQVKTGAVSDMDGFSVIPYYVSELSDEIRIAETKSGKLPDRGNEIAVQAAMLKKMGIPIQIGSQITLDFCDGNSETFTVTGILSGGETAKRFAVFFSKSYADSGSQLKDMPYEVYAKLCGAAAMGPEECKEVMYLIGREAGVERKYVSPSKAFLESLSADSRDILLYALAGAIILFACILVIYGVFYLSVIGKIHQYGQLRTIGMTKKQMKSLVSKEGRRLAAFASPIGLLAGGVAGYLIIPSGFSMVNTLLIAASVFAVIYVITMISVRKPAKLASAVSPMEALRYILQDDMKQTANKKMCRKLTPLSLGAMNFTKNKKKAGVTMLSLAFGGILFMTAAAFMTSFDKEGYARQGVFEDAEFDIRYSDAAVESDENGMSGLQANKPLDEKMIQDIIALDGVKSVAQIKNFGVRFDYAQQDEYDNDDSIYPLTEKETEEIRKYVEDGDADYSKLMSGDYILVSDNANAKEIYGWQFRVGDKITLRYYDGRQMAEKEVTILGTLNRQFTMDNKFVEGWFLMPEQAIWKLISYESLNSHLLVSTEPDKEAEVGEILTQMVEEKSELSMESLAERKAFYTKTADSVFGAIGGLAIFIMMFSMLSMMNTLITNIVTRKQELAVLESIGMAKGQIRKMLLCESLILVLAAVGVTMTVGTLLGYALVSLLRNGGACYMTFAFPWTLFAVYAVVLIVVPLLITLISMKNFSKETLVERLRGAKCLGKGE